jgi:hypothetical protein
MANNRFRDIDNLYHFLDHLYVKLGGTRQLSNCDGRMNWPRRGIYFFFENGEFRADGKRQRVVRVGTHALNAGDKSTLWGRLRTHRGTLGGKYPQGGNHRCSVFRKLIGSALIEREGIKNQSMWSEGKSTSPPIREIEHPLEIKVSEYVRRMPFLWLAVEDGPNQSNNRGIIERGTISLLSNLNGKETGDPASENLLGSCCPNSARGLWNSNFTREEARAKDGRLHTLR